MSEDRNFELGFWEEFEAGTEGFTEEEKALHLATVIEANEEWRERRENERK